ncbi:MAG: 3-deoxy-7-phosphoheptulonate synthase [Planctomycetaceae bacterium]
MTETQKLIQDVNILGTTPLTSPANLKSQLPVSDSTARAVYDSRQAVARILRGEDHRLIAIVGPCSIHNEQIAMEYARRLQTVAKDVIDRMVVVMRVYFEKPRTTVGWKGLINDPHLNDTFDLTAGLELGRKILLNVAELGLPAASEVLEPITPQYIADLITLASIGARTTESPTHRQIASGLSMPVGFKNSTEGSLQVAINAMQAARAQHRFLGMDNDGNTCVVKTRGNQLGHLILRGGRKGPNYDEASLAEATRLLNEASLPPRFVVDCSHANSEKDYTRQPAVWNDVIRQRVAGNHTIVGLMLESNLKAGKQALGNDLSALEYGVSITDGCISFDETERLLRTAYDALGAA